MGRMALGNWVAELKRELSQLEGLGTNARLRAAAADKEAVAAWAEQNRTLAVQKAGALATARAAKWEAAAEAAAARAEAARAEAVRAEMQASATGAKAKAREEVARAELQERETRTRTTTTAPSTASLRWVAAAAGWVTGWSNPKLFSQESNDFSGVPAAAIMGLFLGSGVTFAMLRLPWQWSHLRHALLAMASRWWERSH